MIAKSLKAPAHIGKHGRAFWQAMQRDYSITDAAGLALLATAAVCVDRMRAAQELIAKHGEIVEDRYGGLKPNPATKLELDSRNGFLAAMRSLRIDVEPNYETVGRPAGR